MVSIDYATKEAALAALVLWALLTCAGGSAQPAAEPCASDAHRQFDFWIGVWEVRTSDGTLAGTNRIERAFGGCVLHEQYETGGGFRGASFNVYDAGSDRWHQTWVDNAGTLLLLDGGLAEGRMVLEGQTTSTGGVITAHRITWTPNSDGSVRQHWEATNAAGDRTTVFDGLYTRVTEQ